MAKAKPIDVELVRSLLEYAPELGGSCLRWKVDRMSGRYLAKKAVRKGDAAGSLNSKGYWEVCVCGRLCKAHRLVWAIVKGEDPPCQVDHIHGKEAGNNIENLRLAHKGDYDNQQNVRRRKDNSSGHIGVSFHKKTNKWAGRIQSNGVRHSLGYFDTPEEAYVAYLKAKAELHTFQPTPRGTI